MATDFVLALIAGALAVPLLSGGQGDGRLHAVAWGGAFVFTAAAAVVGGIFHGTRYRLPAAAVVRLWRLTLVLSAPVGFCIVAAAAGLAGPGPAREILLLLGAAKLVVVLTLLIRTSSFAVVAVDSGVSLLLLGVIVGWTVATGPGRPGGWWILAGVLLSLAGAVAQQRGFRAGRAFDHNDVFHLVQAVACFLFFQGAVQG